ncbi:MAG: hypothetical protein HQK76_04615 [Desulfobacterales bacterium]|nr:hypothetical protein [Desulfobacterales bacterium]
MTDKEIKFIGESVTQGFEIYKNNFFPLIIFSGIAWLLSLITMMALSGPLLGSLVIVTLFLTDNEKFDLSTETIFKGFRYFVDLFLFVLIWGVGVGFVVFLVRPLPLGWLISLIISYSVNVLIMFGPFLIVDKNMKFWEASLLSIEKVKNKFQLFFMLYIFAFVLGLSGAILVLIGVFITTPLYFCILSVAYKRVFKKL